MSSIGQVINVLGISILLSKYAAIIGMTGLALSSAAFSAELAQVGMEAMRQDE